VAVGSTAWRWWIIDSLNRMSLELMTLELHSVGAETVQGVRVSVTAIAQVKVCAREENQIIASGPEKGVEKLNKRMILLAAQHFLGEDLEKVRMSLKQTLEGHQRQILGTLTVEQIYKDRAAFSSKVREHVHEDLDHMGFEIVSYSIKELSDQNGYMEALGATQTAMVKREAAEGQAKNEAEARIKVSQADSGSQIEAAKAGRLARVETNSQKQAEAESEQYLDLKKAEFSQRVGEAKERAEAAAKIERAKQQQEVMRQTAEQKVIEKQVETRLTEQEQMRYLVEMEVGAAAASRPLPGTDAARSARGM
jgi:flotillin